MNTTIARPAALLKITYRRTSIRLFGNVSGIKVNLLYALYMAGLKVATATKRVLSRGARLVRGDRIERTAQELRRRGFAKVDAVLDPDFVRGVSRKIDGLFAREEKCVATLQDSGLIRLRASLVEVPELERFLMHPVISNTVQRYFGSHFKVFACDVYRTLPHDPETAAEKFRSLKWHFDNIPSVLLKVMIYLTDTSVETGAISLVPKPTSLELKRRGFWERDKAQSFTDEINQKAVYLEGPPGTTLLFSTHYCIHKATLPTRKHRDVAVFLIQPAFQSQKPFTSEAREIFSSNYGYCVNPFSGAPQRYGEE
jgi:hypothetical protein